MSVDHYERIKGVVKAALKEAALGEPFGFTVNGPGLWPLKNQQGQAFPGPAWFIVVSLRAGLGEPDIWNAAPVPGVHPEDEAFRQTAVGLLNECRNDRDKKESKELAAARAAFKAQVAELDPSPRR